LKEGDTKLNCGAQSAKYTSIIIHFKFHAPYLCNSCITIPTTYERTQCEFHIRIYEYAYVNNLFGCTNAGEEHC
jgi:hypothetical protein